MLTMKSFFTVLFKNNLLFSKLHNFKVFQISKKNIFFKYEKDNSNTPCKTALKHFDSYYKSIFQKNWPSIRLGLLTKEKQVAVINNLVDEEEVESLLKSQGAFDLKNFLEFQKCFSDDQVKHSNNIKESSIDKTIQQTVQATAETEWNEIYSTDKNVSFKSNLYEHTETDKKKELNIDDCYMYDPEETGSSMEKDVSMAQIDESRLILPSSKLNNASSLYEFVPVTKLRGLEDYISETEYYKYYKAKDEIKIKIEKEYKIDFPEHLKVYSFDRGDFSEFYSPKRSANNVFNYLLMNGADLLSVLALNVQPGDTVFDMMSNSGAEAFCIFQSFNCKHLQCASNKNIQSLFNNYLFNFSTNWKEMLSFTSNNCITESNTMFNKILLDVVCTDDRNSVTSLNNNYFFNSRKPERLLLPSNQCDLLVQALKMVKKEGVVVYTTKTMCPIQNDGVVGEAIRKMWEEQKTEFYVKDLSPALNHTKLLFKYATCIGIKYGTLVLPFLPSNFGPRYIAKIVRAPC